MEYIVGCDNLHNKLCEMIDESTQYVYLTSFELDIEFEDLRLHNRIVDALKRCVHVYVMTCGLCVTDVKYKLLYKLKKIFPKYLHLKLNHMRKQDKEFVEPTFEKIFDFLAHSKFVSDHDWYAKLQGKSATGLHLRYVGNEKEILIGGGNYSKKYSGSIYDNDRGKYQYAWIETGLLLQGEFQKTMKLLFADKYSSVKYPFITSSLDHYHYIIYRINKAKKRIYFENQYFFTHSKYSQNKIWYELARRLIKSIRKNEDFHFTLKINWDCKDETSLRYDGTAALIRASVKDMILFVKGATQASDEIINKYISVWTSTSDAKLVFHSKVYMFDDNHCLVTSANIYDACLYSKGHQELGYVIENNPSICKQIIDAVPNSLLRRVVLNETFAYEPPFPYNQDNAIIRTLLTKFLLFSPIHTDMDQLSVLCDVTPYTCDRVNYNDLKKRPSWI